LQTGASSFDHEQELTSGGGVSNLIHRFRFGTERAAKWVGSWGLREPTAKHKRAGVASQAAIEAARTACYKFASEA